MPANTPAQSASFLMKWVSRLHVFIYQASGGRIGATISRLPVLLLTTAGRKTGKRRVTPLVYLRDAEDLVLIASNGGHDWHPAWYFNLRAEPAAEIQLRRLRRRVSTRTADEGERKRLWPAVVTLYAGYAKYQALTGRLIPLVILEGAGWMAGEQPHP